MFEKDEQVSDPLPRAKLLALLAALKAEPDDDTPKLALADWLEEQDYAADRARGEFLRALVAIDRISPGDPSRPSALARLNDLWRNHPAWLGPLQAAGFRCSHTSARWGMLFPGIDGTQLVSAKALAVAGSEEYAWVAGLSFSRIGPRQNRRFAHSPLIESLIGLRYDRCVEEATPMVDLSGAPGASGLKYLTLCAARIGAEGIAALAGTTGSTSNLGKLRELSLQMCDIGGDAGFRLLCNSPALNELRMLDVTSTGLTIHSARAFADGVGLPALREMSFEGGAIGPDGTLILVHTANVGRLRRLNLSSNGVADYGVEAVCRSEHVRSLEYLDLSNNLLTRRAAIALASTENLDGLEELVLRRNNIDEEGALALAKARGLKYLSSLNIGGNDIGPRGAAALRERFGDRVAL
jgi:uncharacterized protein (TIGR02996 family)